MARVDWGSAGERFFELGIDQGVLYVGENPGVPWNGITNVDESPTGGEPRPFFVDGVKFVNTLAPESFEATLSAYYSPVEFDVCDGAWYLRDGIYATQQAREPFGLTYRTKVGNDINAENHGYKIHLVYNAQAEPTSRSYATVTDSIGIDPLSWHLTTSPILLGETRLISHIVVNSLTLNPGALKELEDILYGTETTIPRLPYPHELLDLIDTPLGIDAGHVSTVQTLGLDGGVIPVQQTEFIDGGRP